MGNSQPSQALVTTGMTVEYEGNQLVQTVNQTTVFMTVENRIEYSKELADLGLTIADINFLLDPANLNKFNNSLSLKYVNGDIRKLIKIKQTIKNDSKITFAAVVGTYNTALLKVKLVAGNVGTAFRNTGVLLLRILIVGHFAGAQYASYSSHSFDLIVAHTDFIVSQDLSEVISAIHLP